MLFCTPKKESRGRGNSTSNTNRSLLGLLAAAAMVLLATGSAQAVAIYSYADMPGAGFTSPGGLSPSHPLGPYAVDGGGGTTVTVTSRSYAAGSTSTVAGEPANMGSHTAGGLCSYGLCYPVDPAVAPGDWWGETGIGGGGIVLNFDQPVSAAGLSLIFTLKPGNPMQGILITAFDSPNNTGQELGTALSASYPFVNSYDPAYESYWYNVRFFVGIELGTAEIRSLLIQNTGGLYTPSIDGYALRAAAVPEPGTALLLGLGLAGLGVAGTRPRRTSGTNSHGSRTGL